MIVYLTALCVAVAFVSVGVWAIRRSYPENVCTGLQRNQVAILEDDEGNFIEGECTNA